MVTYLAVIFTTRNKMYEECAKIVFFPDTFQFKLQVLCEYVAF